MVRAVLGSTALSPSSTNWMMLGAQSPFEGVVVDVITLEDAVGLEHLFVHVAEERKG